MDAGFRARVAELVVQRAKDDSNVGIKEAVADPDGSESLGGDDSFSGDEEGGEEEDEGGSDGGDEEGSGEDDDDEDGSDDDENDAAPDVGENELPSCSNSRMILRIPKARTPPVYKTPKQPLELENEESSDDQVSRRSRAKCNATIRDSDGSGSDMELGGSSEGNEALFAGPSAEEEMLMKEQSDQQVMAVDNMMLPAHVGSKPGGNRYFLI